MSVRVVVGILKNSNEGRAANGKQPHSGCLYIPSVVEGLFVAMLTDDPKLETGLIDVQIRLLMENMK